MIKRNLKYRNIYSTEEKKCREKIVKELNDKYKNKKICIIDIRNRRISSFIEKANFFSKKYNVNCVCIRDNSHGKKQTIFDMKTMSLTCEMIFDNYEERIKKLLKKYKNKEISIVCRKLIQKKDEYHYESDDTKYNFILDDIVIKDITTRWTSRKDIVIIDKNGDTYTNFLMSKISIIKRIINPVYDPFGEENWSETNK